MNKNNDNILPIYIGDDVSDEDAFKQFNANGITIKVGRDKNTNAKYFLDSPKQVMDFLDQLNRLRINDE